MLSQNEASAALCNLGLSRLLLLHVQAAIGGPLLSANGLMKLGSLGSLSLSGLPSGLPSMPSGGSSFGLPRLSQAFAPMLEPDHRPPPNGAQRISSLHFVSHLPRKEACATKNHARLPPHWAKVGRNGRRVRSRG